MLVYCRCCGRLVHNLDQYPIHDLNQHVTYLPVEHTKAQLALRETVNAWLI